MEVRGLGRGYNCDLTPCDLDPINLPRENVSRKGLGKEEADRGKVGVSPCHWVQIWCYLGEEGGRAGGGLAVSAYTLDGHPRIEAPGVHGDGSVHLG